MCTGGDQAPGLTCSLLSQWFAGILLRTSTFIHGTGGRGIAFFVFVGVLLGFGVDNLALCNGFLPSLLSRIVWGQKFFLFLLDIPLNSLLLFFGGGRVPLFACLVSPLTHYGAEDDC